MDHRPQPPRGQSPRPPERDRVPPEEPDSTPAPLSPAAMPPPPPAVVAPPDPVVPSPPPSAPSPREHADQAALAPLPPHPAAFRVPAHQQFRYEGSDPLTASDLDVISTFHAQYMQGQGIGDDYRRFQQAKREATFVLPLMQRQYQLACQGQGGANSQEALQIQRNIQWVDELLKMGG